VIRGRTGACAAALVLVASAGEGAELRPHTVAAFDRYVRLTEARLDGDAVPFLWIDAQKGRDGGPTRSAARGGALLIERLTTLDAGREIDVPDGLIHHWIGTTFIKGATVDRAVALLQDYDRHSELYAPVVTRSRLLKRSGDTFVSFLRFRQKKVITVVVNTENEARFSRPGPGRAEARIHSTRIAEVDHPDTPQETEKPVGNDGGYLWRLNTYWRLLEADGGLYLQCESVTLTRDIPTGLGWLIRPFVTSIPRESLEFTLNTSRRILGS
jgi:hypothetical protein